MKAENHTQSIKKHMLLPVILAGGVGSRLWPLSREAHPKPFITLNDGKSLIQKTYQRAAELPNIKEIVTVTNRELFFYTKDEYDAIDDGKLWRSFILEPFGRNSSAAIALAARYAQTRYGDDCILLILPADHLIDDQATLTEAVQQACTLASQDKLVTFGIEPSGPKTGYGYIEADGTNVKRFVEKPNLETATSYLASGNYYWNSGMFCMKAGSILKEMEALCPDVAESTLASFDDADRSEGENWSQLAIRPESFKPVKDISIDYAVFEPSNNVAVVPCNIGWSDIGSWLEFGELQEKDDANNHCFGDTLLENVTNCIIHSESKLIAGLGLDNLVIADTADALLIAHKDQAQNVRKIVSKLKENKHPCYKMFPTVHRPWGTFTTLLEGAGFKLKKIEVKPGCALSLQSHQHRSEHWVVVSGTAKVTNGEHLIELKHNESTYIEAGHKHRLENASDESLVVVEVQCGAYLSEDDIVRYDDVYGRSEHNGAT